QPVNIHLTGCHHSCAQHYIGDIGLIACKIIRGEDDDEQELEGYHIFVGGSSGATQRIATEMMRDVIAEEAPLAVEKILRTYMEYRESVNEDFISFVSRHDRDALLGMMEQISDVRAA
ncbi:MAG: NirA family protein, partial [Gammaproteobacteria bacterium]|nr:NirA family protein [Gammaproteobacteria bacterium]